MLNISIILIVGALTTYTDFKKQKILNQHLALGAILCIIAFGYAAIFTNEPVVMHIINGLIASLIGWLLFQLDLWRGGDAKLFTLYAFLMPITTYNTNHLPNVISLFACSFIIGMIFLTPVFIKDIFIYRTAIINDLFMPTKLQALFRAIVVVVVSTWVLFPVYHLIQMTNPVVMVTISYLLLHWRYKVKNYVIKNFLPQYFKKTAFEIIIGIILGYLMRLWLLPDSLSFFYVAKNIILIIIYTVISICIHATFSHFKDYQNRVPFAPLLLLGCALSYTPFLTWVMDLRLNSILMLR